MARHLGGRCRLPAGAERQPPVRTKSAQSAREPAAAGQTPASRAGGPTAGGRAAAGRGAQPRLRKALLAWADTRNGQAQHAFTSHALAIIERLGYDSGLWDTFIRTDSHIIFNQAQKTDGTPASGGPSLSNVDGIFFLGHRDVPINDQQKAELLAFVRSGKGFVAAHTGLTAFESWPEFGEMLGATYGGHLYTGPGRMISEQPAHPLVRHWGTTADYRDEFYRANGLSRDKVDVLLRFDPASAPGVRAAVGRRLSSRLDQDLRAGTRRLQLAVAQHRGVGRPEPPDHDARSNQMVPGPDRGARAAARQTGAGRGHDCCAALVS